MFWKGVGGDNEADAGLDDDGGRRPRFIARAFAVFKLQQVDLWSILADSAASLSARPAARHLILSLGPALSSIGAAQPTRTLTTSPVRDLLLPPFTGRRHEYGFALISQADPSDTVDLLFLCVSFSREAFELV